MHVSSVEVASWIIVYYFVIRLLPELMDAGRKRRKGLAAKLEFHDQRTSEERKRELLARYAKQIVPEPAYSFYKAAQKREKEERPALKDELILGLSMLLFGAVLIGLWQLGKIFFSHIFN